LIREASGIHPRNYIPVPIHLPNGFPVKKSCRPVGTTQFLPIQKVKPLAATPAPAKPDPIYLFHCGIEWQKRAETSAGWELIQAMRSEDKGTRALAAELLAGTENGRLLVRDLRRVPQRVEPVGTKHRRTLSDSTNKRGRHAYAIRTRVGRKLHKLHLAK